MKVRLLIVMALAFSANANASTVIKTGMQAENFVFELKEALRHSANAFDSNDIVGGCFDLGKIHQVIQSHTVSGNFQNSSSLKMRLEFLSESIESFRKKEICSPNIRYFSAAAAAKYLETKSDEIYSLKFHP